MWFFESSHSHGRDPHIRNTRTNAQGGDGDGGEEQEQEENPLPAHIERSNNGNTPMHFAAATNAVRAVQYLHAKFPMMVTKVNTDGQTPLHVAAAAGHTEACKALLEMGCDVNTADTRGYTAVHTAVDALQATALDVLLHAEGVDVNVTVCTVHCAV